METLTTNSHFKEVLKEVRKYLERDEEPPFDLFSIFVNELKVSNLMLPAADDGNGFTCEAIEMEETGETYLPVFTDIEEYEKHETFEEFGPTPLSFEEYMDLIFEEDYDGMFVNVMGDGMPLDRNFLSNLDFEVDNVNEIEEPYTGEELRDMFGEISNAELIEFLKADDDDLEGLYVQLSNSRLINLLVSDSSNDVEAKDGIVDVGDGEGLSLFVAQDKNGISLLALFTDKQALKNMEMKPDLHYYGQISVLSALFEYVLRNDLDGIVINLNTDDFIITRDAILPQASGIEIIAEDSRFFDSLRFAFPL